MLKKPNHLDNLTLAMNVLYYVGFIVIIFLMTTSHLKQRLPINIKPPLTSSNVIFDPDGEWATIIIGHGKIMIELPDTIKKQTLIAMGDTYHINFSKAEIAKFRGVDVVGVPFDSLKHYINGYFNNESYYNQIGIRIDSSKNELANWIQESRKAFYEVTSGEKLRFFIYADRNEGYPQIKRIFDILEQQGEHKWSLITWTKSKE